MISPGPNGAHWGIPGPYNYPRDRSVAPGSAGRAFDTVFLDALEKFIENRNALVHQASTIPGWDMKNPNGRIAAFIFLKNLQFAKRFGGLSGRFGFRTVNFPVPTMIITLVITISGKGFQCAAPWG
jgi:hypothetical protein